MAALTIAICDDNQTDLQDERDLIEEALLNIKSKYDIDVFSSPADLLNSSKKYHIVFLDVEMDELNGIVTASAIHKKNSSCLIFFVTNHEHYIDEALNKHAFRFWVKPIELNRLIFGINSAIEEIRSRRRILTVNVNKRKVNIVMNSIIYAYTANRITYIVTVRGTIETKDIFKNIKEQLNESYFCKVHASYCVNMRYVTAYTVSDVTCKYRENIYEIPMSKSKSAAFRQKFAEWSGGTI